MELTLSAAAHATGKGKSTLLRAVKSGKLSARRTEDGTFLVDASELARVFPVTQLERTTDAPRITPEPAHDAGGVEVSVLQVKVAMLEDQLHRERDTVEDLRKRLDRAEERVYQLTHQSLQETPRPPQEPPRSGGLLRRLLGR